MLVPDALCVDLDEYSYWNIGNLSDGYIACLWTALPMRVHHRENEQSSSGFAGIGGHWHRGFERGTHHRPSTWGGVVPVLMSLKFGFLGIEGLSGFRFRCVSCMSAVCIFIRVRCSVWCMLNIAVYADMLTFGFHANHGNISWRQRSDVAKALICCFSLFSKHQVLYYMYVHM